MRLVLGEKSGSNRLEEGLPNPKNLVGLVGQVEREKGDDIYLKISSNKVKKQYIRSMIN